MNARIPERTARAGTPGGGDVRGGAQLEWAPDTTNAAMTGRPVAQRISTHRAWSSRTSVDMPRCRIGPCHGKEFTRMLSVTGEPSGHPDARRGDLRGGARLGRASPMASAAVDYAGAQGNSRGEAA